MRGRVLVIAGSDSGGGAGIQADIKTITAFGAYAATAITALTAQNTLGVEAVHMVPPEFIAQQIVVVLDDIGADVVKTGMLGDAATIEVVCDTLARHAADVPMVVDPVMVATSGARLLADDAVAMLRDRLLPMACVITPNLPEAEALTGMAIADVAAMHRAASRAAGAGRAGGAAEGRPPAGRARGGSCWRPRDGVEDFTAPRIDSRHTHGTGCTLASAIAAGLAQGLDHARRGAARARLCAGGDRSRARVRRRAWAAEPPGWEMGRVRVQARSGSASGAE